MRYVIEKGFEGRLLREYLRAIGVSSVLLARLKRRENGILLNGRHVTVRALLSAGDLLELAIEDEASPEKIVPTDLPLEILFEDDDLLVLNKPSGMPTHPSHGHFTDTLANALAFHFTTRGEIFSPRFINRLDRDTTGVVLVARHALSAAALSSAMAKHEIKKHYLALVTGRVDRPMAIEGGIRRAQESIILREVCPVEDGDFAKTEVLPIAATDAFSLVSLVPHTGRTHQLRLHMASIGHPLLGDALYGNANDGFPRHALHAARLGFLHPVTGEMLSICALLPADMAEKVNTLGKGVMALVEQEYNQKL